MIDYDFDMPNPALKKQINRQATIVFDLDETLVKCVLESKLDKYPLLKDQIDKAVRIPVR